jgi:hypothetical protein
VLISYSLTLNCVRYFTHCYCWKVQENQDELELNGIHQHLVYADDVNISVGNMNTTKKNREALLRG